MLVSRLAMGKYHFKYHLSIAEENHLLEWCFCVLKTQTSQPILWFRPRFVLFNPSITLSASSN